MLLCIPYPIPSVYFPLVIFLMLSIFEGPSLQYLIAMGLGFAYQRGYLSLLIPTSYFFENLESSGIWFKISRMRGWVLAASSLGHDAFVAVNASQIERDRDPSSSTSRSSGGGRSSSNSATKSGGKRNTIHGFGDLSDDTEANGGSADNTSHQPGFTSVIIYF